MTGRRPETADVVAGWQARIGQPLRHVWHPDEGFRLAEIRNRAIGATEAAYIIFLDGDCVPRRGFIADHRRLSEPGWFVTGSRILLSKELTEEVLAEGHPFRGMEHRRLARRASARPRRTHPAALRPAGSVLAEARAEADQGGARLQHGLLAERPRPRRRLRCRLQGLGVGGLGPRHPPHPDRRAAEERALRRRGLPPLAPGRRPLRARRTTFAGSASSKQASGRSP